MKTITEKRDLLWGVLNAVRVALKFDNLKDLPGLLPRIEEVLLQSGSEDEVLVPQRIGAYNIEAEVAEYASRLGLGEAATGGGCDFVVKRFSDDMWHPIAVLGGQADAESPASLDEPSEVRCYTAEDWMEGTSFLFNSAREAMDWMAKQTKIPEGGSPFN